MTISVVVPVLNDAAPLARLIADLRADPDLQIVVVDGGSDDASASAAADVVASSAPGRGTQMRVGAEHAAGDWLWFLHADSRIGAAALAALKAGLGAPCWGFFTVRLDSSAWPFRIVERGMNWRSAMTGIATGDQGIFVHRRLLDAVGGVPALPLMEDVECCKRLRRLAAPRCVGTPIEASARRWQRDGIVRTVALMWLLRLRYAIGADATALARRYYQ